MSSLAARIRAAIEADGPMPFDRFVELALYDEADGFYATGGQAGGARGDFVTSVETGPLFGAVIGDWLDARWQSAGRPAEFRVAESAAGVGTLYRAIARSAPACFDALVYTLVERSTGLRNRHSDLPAGRHRSTDTLPTDQHVIMANELLDNLAFGIAERTGSGWVQLDVSAGLELVASTRSWSPPPDVGDLPIGTRVPIASEAARWITTAQDSADWVLVFDYGADTADLASRGDAGWLRTYRGHDRAADPFAEIGDRDITCDVPFDQLPPPMTRMSQADWLRAAGIEQRVSEARDVWRERAAIGDLAAMVARSAVNEAAALTDPAGLGGFVALEWSGRSLAEH